MLIILALCLLQLFHVDACETSKDGVTWTFDDSVDELVTGVETFEECRNRCVEKESCTAYTFQKVPLNLCFLFSNPSEQVTCPVCRSGFLTQIVSGRGCTLDLANIVNVVVINSVEECLDLCAGYLECTNFLYFNSNSILKNVCLLYSGCNGTTACMDCQSGQLECFAPVPDLPEECTNYRVLDDPTRNIQYDGPERYCDSDTSTSPDWQGPGSYRLEGAGGSRIPEQDPGYYHCGTQGSGWTEDTHPEFLGQQKSMTVCFYSIMAIPCTFSRRILATNCGDYMVYSLPEVPSCEGSVSYRYCGENY